MEMNVHSLLNTRTEFFQREEAEIRFRSCLLWCYWPEREGVVSNKSLTLPHQEGAVLGPTLAVLLQELLRHLSTITTSTQLPVEPALCTVLFVVVTLLTNYRKEWRDKKEHSALFAITIIMSLPPFLHRPLLHQLTGNEMSPLSSKSYYLSGQNNVESMSVNHTKTLLSNSIHTDRFDVNHS